VAAAIGPVAEGRGVIWPASLAGSRLAHVAHGAVDTDDAATTVWTTSSHLLSQKSVFQGGIGFRGGTDVAVDSGCVEVAVAAALPEALAVVRAGVVGKVD
jgi:hypothetical protein